MGRGDFIKSHSGCETETGICADCESVRLTPADPKPLTRGEVQAIHDEHVKGLGGLAPQSTTVRLCADWLRMEAERRELREALQRLADYDNGVEDLFHAREILEETR